ncbi:hypothetical protein PF004_g14943 [Phytophthora fragariae]|uniref:Reverse transcriptase/retrotransposon-derived protein RNase H-like domain-containing protein n=1 Tax=Phytophthora fragariae TaxID=53985 RepID=A0A6G0NMP9_9STRA|nr:hypothetical protein PF004_g14943 [Phytophthora fragariae]
MNYAFDCILGIPWLVRYQPQIDWLARSVKRRQDFDVTEVFKHLLVAPRDWPHVTVVDGASTTHVVRRASDGPLCTTFAVLLTGDEDEEPARGRASERRAVEHPWLPRMKNQTVEQRLPYVKEAVEQWFPPSNEAVEQRFPSTNEAVEQWFPPTNEAVDQRRPHANEAVEQRLPHVHEAVEQRLPHAIEAVEQGLPHDDAAVEQELPARANGADENELSRLEEGEASSSESDTSILSRGSRRSKTSRRSKRRLKPRRAVDLSSAPTESVCTVEYVDGAPNRTRVIEVASPPRDVKSITSLPGLSWKNFLRDLKAEDIEQVCLITDGDSVSHAINSVDSVDTSSRPKSAEPKSTAREFADVFPDKIPAELPADRGVRHDIDLAPGSKYCVTRQWPLPRDQVKVIDGFFEGRRQAGHVRESISPHSSPTFCVKKATGGWRIVHAFNKLNDATIPAQTPIPREDMVLDSMSGSVIDIFVHSRAEGDLNAVEVHVRHLRQVFQVMRENKLYANLKKCIFCAPEIPVLGCYVSKNGVRADPEKISSICSWPTPTSPTVLRHGLGLANYLHKYTKDYAGLIQPLSSLLKKGATWLWRPEHQAAFDSVKTSLASAPILMLTDDSKPFHVVCDASDFAIGCALMQFDDEGRERVVSYQSRQMKPAEHNYPVHDKELLAMR